MKKNVFFILLILLHSVFSLSADESTVKQVKGIVEIKQGQAGWIKAENGMKLSPGILISTGFKSSAILELDNSEIYLKQLTRISIDEISKSGNTVKTNLNLSLGRVKANVKTSEGLKHNFTLKTPVSTAAVRGTVFESGVRSLDVESGSIRYANMIGQQVTVPGGTSSQMGITGFSAPADIADAINEAFSVESSTNMDEAADTLTNLNIRTTGSGKTVVTVISEEY